MLDALMLSFLAKQFGITEGQVAELVYLKSEDGEKLDKSKLKEGALEVLLSKDADRVKALKGNLDKTKIHNEAYDKAKKEILSKSEKQLTEKYGITGEKLEMAELVEKIRTEAVAAATKGTELTDDKVKAHPAYLKLESVKNQTIESLNATHKTTVNELTASHAKKDSFRGTKDVILGHFDELNPVLSTDAKKANYQRNAFADQFADQDFTYVEGQTEPVLLNKDGSRMEDEHGNPRLLADLVSSKAGLSYDFKKQNDKGNSGNSGNAGGSTAVPQSEAEYNEAIFNATSDEDIAAIDAAYNGAQ